MKEEWSWQEMRLKKLKRKNYINFLPDVGNI